MTIVSQQYLKKVNFELLKNLKNVEIDFSGSRLTAIVGINGSGKSTVLHALACCYKPLNIDLNIDYKFSQFFTPTPNSIWQGSRLTMCHDYRIDRVFHENVSTVYSKISDRWSPKYERRPSRNIIYLGINSCVPTIEAEKQMSYISYSTTNLTDDISRQIKEKAGFVMNRDSSYYNLHTSSKRSYIGVEHNNTSYSSLSMSAGEQRIFKIISEVFKAPKNSLKGQLSAYRQLQRLEHERTSKHPALSKYRNEKFFILPILSQILSIGSLGKI
jgi:ABC-type dipeptide/oligopeptide/nickel transport system ATPase subunit